MVNADGDATPWPPGRWAELLPLLDEALRIDDATAREAWRMRQSPTLREPLRMLLERHASLQDSDFLRHGASVPAQARSPRPAAAEHHPGQRIGRWRLVALLGQGGMAEVWRAAQADGTLDREVALKLPRLGRLPGLAERLRRERGILAQLRHPNIAAILDAGEDDGQPWLALELIEGRSLADHAQAQALTVPQRLALFADVLRAVAHAHERLVVHRDLKPANVLVANDGTVKLLDFGVAKLLAADTASTEDTALTQLGGRAMTPQYASPEQVAGQPLTTRSDLYALGVLLYELLAGKRPYTLRRGSAAELEEAILGAAVRKPSQAAAEPRLARALRGDLDTIVLKAMALDPAQRYASAEAFAADLERHRRNLPIDARPASALDRLAKLWRRQRVALSAGTLATGAVLAGLAWALVERTQAQAQARRAEAVQVFLATTLEGTDPEVAQGRPLSARELLDRSAARIDTDFAATPDVQPRVHQTVATLYNRLGDMAAALRHIDSAIAGYERQGESGGPEHAEMLFQRHEALIDLARWDDARAAVARALAVVQGDSALATRYAPRLVGSRGWIALQQGRLADAAADAARASAMQQQATGERSTEMLAALTTEAIVAQQSGHYARAVAVQRRIGELGPTIEGHSTTDVLVERCNLANVLALHGDPLAALPIFEAAVPALLRHLGPTHDRSLSHRMSWAQAQAEAGRLEPALLLLRQALADAEGRGVDGDIQPTILRAALARTLVMAGRADEALPLAQRAQAEFEQRDRRPTWGRERTRWFVAEALIGSGDVAGGLAILESVAGHLERLLPNPQHPALAQLALVRAVALRERDLPAARGLAAEACQRLEAAGEDGALRLPRCRAIQAWLDALAAGATAADDRAAALQRFVAARDAALARLPDPHPLREQLMQAEAELRAAPGAPSDRTLRLLN
jgi:serine/threonine-protein kinase